MKSRSHTPHVIYRSLLCGSLFASVTMCPSYVFAQVAPALEPHSTVSDEGTTLNIGLDIGSGYTDNLFATRNYEVDDFLIVARPSARLTTSGDRGRFTLRAEGELGRHAEFETEDYNDWLIGADGRFRLSPNLLLLGGGDYQWEHESRSSPDAESGREPTKYQLLHAFAGAVLTFGKTSFRPAILFDRFDFEDVRTQGGSINNDDRDRTHVELGSRLSQQVAKGTDLFIQTAWNRREYRQLLDDAGFRRESKGGSINIGVRRSFSPRLSGEIFAGYLQQDYRDPRLKDVGALDLGALVEWRGPHGLGATFRADRSVEETTLAGASSYLLTSGSLTLRASPHPRLLTGLTLGGSKYGYQGDPRSEFVTSSDLWLRYWLSRNFYAGLEYRLAQRTSNAAGFDYDENRILFRLGTELRPGYESDVSAPALVSISPGGAYAGLFIGHGALVTGLHGPRGNDGSNIADFGGTGFGYGGMLGYGFTVGDVYVGAELEGLLQGADWLHVADRTFSVEKAAGAGVAARMGWLTPARDLVFARVGASRATLETRYRHSESDIEESYRHTGIFVGLGAEAAMGSRGFVRAEYVLTSYNDKDVPTGGGSFDNFSNSEGHFRLGGGIRFGRASARAQQQVTSFAGPYIGLQFGHGTLVSRNLGVRSGGTEIDISRAGNGVDGGVFAGIGLAWQRLYLGGEAEADVSKVDWNIERDPNGRIYSAQRQHSLGAAVRVGWLISDNAMIYGRVGPAHTRFKIPYSTSSVSTTSEKSRIGLRVGGGLELGLGARARFRIDYTATDYPAYDVEYGQEADRFDHDESLVRLGLGWAL